MNQTIIFSAHGFLLPLSTKRVKTISSLQLFLALKQMSGTSFLFSNGTLLHTPDAPSVKVLLEAHSGACKMSKNLTIQNTIPIIYFSFFWFILKYDLSQKLFSDPGAYTTSRTHNNGSYLLFWERHLKRLSESMLTLSKLAPHFLFKSDKSTHLLTSSLNLPIWQPTVQMLVNDSMCKVLPLALKERNGCEELAITTLVTGNLEELNAQETMEYEERLRKTFDVHVHVGTYVPPSFGMCGYGAHLALVGCGRDVAAAKYSDWVR